MIKSLRDFQYIKCWVLKDFGNQAVLITVERKEKKLFSTEKTKQKQSHAGLEQHDGGWKWGYYYIRKKIFFGELTL